MSRARSHQPLEQKLTRLRSLTDKAAYKKKEVERTVALVDRLQERLNEAREKLLSLEAEVRAFEQESAELLRECQAQHGELDMDEDGEEEDQSYEEAKQKHEEAERQWQEVLPRRLMRARAKSRGKRSTPYGGYGDEGELWPGSARRGDGFWVCSALPWPRWLGCALGPL